MKKFKYLSLLCLGLIGLTLKLDAQDKKYNTYKYWVELKDKNTDEYSTDKPIAFLTQKAIDRREKHGIAITEQDFPVNEEYVTTLIEDYDVKVLARSRWFNALIVEANNENDATKLMKASFVKSTTLLGKWFESTKDEDEVSEEEELLQGKDSSYYKALDQAVKDFKEPGYQSGVDFMDYSVLMAGRYGQSLKQIKMLNGVKMHQLGYEGQGMTIAVLDAGFWKVNTLDEFDSLRKNNQILGTRDFVDFDGDVYKDGTHGMQVLSCMGANIPGAIVGTAPKANYWLIRTEDGGSEFPVEEANWVIGIEFADSIGADVVNSSLGYTTFDDKKLFKRSKKTLDGKVSLASRAADLAVARGIIVCTSAGNAGDEKWKYIGAPADAFNVIAVGGVTKSKKRSNFSSLGPTADKRIKPDLCAVGTNSAVTEEDGGVGTANGTSFASPILCGMVTCFWQAHQDKKNLEIIKIIKENGTHHKEPNNELGHGVPDFYAAHIQTAKEASFDYEKDALISPTLSDFNRWLDIRFYSASSQNITIKLDYEEKEGEAKKTIYSGSHSAQKGKVFSLTLEDEIKKVGKLSDGRFYLTVTNGSGDQFIRDFQR